MEVHTKSTSTTTVALEQELRLCLLDDLSGPTTHKLDGSPDINNIVDACNRYIVCCSRAKCTIQKRITEKLHALDRAIKTKMSGRVVAMIVKQLIIECLFVSLEKDFEQSAT
jgi:hypothetical protein